MKLFIAAKSFKTIGQGLVASAILTAGLVIADDTPATSSTTQGAGAAKLSSNSEEAETSASGIATAARPGDAKSFLREAMEGNLAEVALAQVAERKSQNSDVKQFAQMIRRDHEKANQELQPIARANGIVATQSLDAKHQKKLEKFQSMSASEFDREYVTEMLKDHQKDIAKYEHASKHLKEADVQQYAQTTLPTLRQHLQHATQTAQAVGVDQATISAILKESSDAMGGTADSPEKSSGTSESSQDSMAPGAEHAPQGPMQNP